MQRRLVLASRSPRRRELLRQLGLTFDIVDVDVPEQRDPDEVPEDYVSRVALAKAEAGLRTLAYAPGAVILGADTEVVLDGTVFGKPADPYDASAMLRKLSGRSHRVVSALWCVGDERREHTVRVTTVRFAALDDEEIAAYVSTGEWAGKAGAYAIQGRAAAFVEHLEGSYSAVMGLPLHEAACLLRRFGSFRAAGGSSVLHTDE